MTPAESVDRPPFAPPPETRTTAFDLIGQNYAEHVHLCTFHEPFLYPLGFNEWLVEWVRAELAKLRRRMDERMTALEQEWRTVEGNER